MTNFSKRHAISRARFFLEQAEKCSVTERDAFESYLEAAIIFGRTAIHRLKHEHEKHPEWKPWWNWLLTNPAAEFFRHERNSILKEGPPKVGQIITWDAVSRAAELYSFDDPETPATETVRQHLDELAKIVAGAEARFGS